MVVIINVARLYEKVVSPNLIICLVQRDLR
jgi:hypothetical protein